MAKEDIFFLFNGFNFSYRVAWLIDNFMQISPNSKIPNDWLKNQTWSWQEQL